MAKTDAKGIAQKFIANVVPGVVRPLRVLWNEIIGFLFLAFAVMMLRSVWRNYQEVTADDPATFFKFLMTAAFCATMAGFGIHSFWRAKRISRS